jgi:ubiquinone/menaquinone biosynthesis C-methylase UbiE
MGELTGPGSKPTRSGDTVDYRLAAVGREAAEDQRLRLVEEIYDPASRRRRAGLVQPGWHCLEVGAGRGSMAVWLAEQVGPAGEVVAVDIDTSYLDRLELPNLRVVKHNILAGPLESGSFDMVCSRLMLFHLRERQQTAIGHMAECLRPGGLLFDEDADWGTVGPVDPAHRSYAKYHEAWRNGDWWVARGFDPVFGRKLPALFERAGLSEVVAESSTEVVRGGSPWALWYAETLDVMHRLGGGATSDAQQVEHDLITSTFRDPSVWLIREILHACSGRRL